MTPAADATEDGGLLVGDLMVVRTFRLAVDGRLFPVNSPRAWTPGRNTAVCNKQAGHRAPEPACSCGFYANSHPVYLGAQPPARHVRAVVAMSGTVEIGSRGARGRDARITAVWLGPHVDPLLELQVAAQYPQVPLYRDEELMLAEHPLTGQPIFEPPRFGPRPRMVGRLALWAYAATVTVVGILPATLTLARQPRDAASVLLGALALAVLGVSAYERSVVVALFGVDALGWLDAGGPPILAATMHGLLLTTTITAVIVWRLTARPGLPVPNTPRPPRTFGS